MKLQKVIRISDKDLMRSFYNRYCIVCGRYGCDPAHILTRGAGNDDTENNILALCRRCHQESGQIGLKKFTDKHPEVLLDLEARGFYFDQHNKLRRNHRI